MFKSKYLRGLAARLSARMHDWAGGDAQADSSDESLRAALAENAIDLITHHDEKGRVLFASRAALSLCGTPAENLLGEGLFERVHVADRPAYLTVLSRCRSEDETAELEFRLRQANDAGHYVWVEMRCRPMPERGDGLVAVTRDISGHKTQEEELLRIRDEAESANNAKTQFLATMSHELRTPLNAVIGFSEILNRELFGALGEARYRDYAGLIHESGQHLLHVVNDILDMSKIEASKFDIVKEPFDAGVLVKSCCDVMRHAAEQKSIALQTDIAPNLPKLAADKRACKQILLNVISNAIKFTGEGGFVLVSAQVENGDIAFVVADNGIGIAEEDLPRLGNPFVQAHVSYDRSYDGAGLGLSVVNGLVRLHGGRLELASALGEGTTATILLPLDADESAEPLPRAMSAA